MAPGDPIEPQDLSDLQRHLAEAALSGSWFQAGALRGVEQAIAAATDDRLDSLHEGTWSWLSDLGEIRALER